MSNIPTLPDADVTEPVPDDTYDDDAVGVPMEDDEDVDSDLPNSANSPLPSDVEPENYDDSIQKPM